MQTTPFELRAENHHWMGKPPAADICSHADLFLRVGDVVLLDPALGGAWFTSAAAMHLLRTLDSDHIVNPAEHDLCQIIPCCGSSFVDDHAQVQFMCCDSGLNWNVRHREGSVRLWNFLGADLARADQGKSSPDVIVPLAMYRDQVVSFSEEVANFFKNSDPKTPEPDDETSFRAFWQQFTDLLKEAKA